MRVCALHVEGFGSLRGRVFDFGAGVTVLLGPNESGKSTVLHCLSQVLLGKPTQRGSFQDFRPWDGGPFAAAAEFVAQDQRYRLVRRFADTGARAQALYRLGDHGEETLVAQETGVIRRHLAASLGTADDRVFYRVFCLSRADYTPLDNFGGLREHLERAMSGTDETVTTAMQTLDERLAALRRGLGQPALPQNRGMLKRAGDARCEWEARLHEARRQHARLHELRTAAEALRRQLDDTTSRLDLLAEVLEHDRRRRELLARLAAARATWSGLEAERERLERLAAEQRRLRELLAALPPAYADPPALRARLLAVERGSGSRWWPGLALLLGGALLAAAGYALFRHPAAWGLLLAGVLAGVPVLLRALGSARAAAGLRAELREANLAEVNLRLEAAERYRRELDATTLALTAVGDSDDLAERRRAGTLDIAVLEEQLAQYAGTPLTAEEAHRLTAEQQALREALPGLREQEHILLRERAVLEESERDLVDLEDGVAYWRAEETRAREDEQGLQLARELLLEAGKRIHRGFTEPLSARIAPLFAAMTGGRYPRVQVHGDAGQFHITPLLPDGTPVPVEQLSRGAADQFVLAVRLALGRTLADPRGAPLFLLDDPLLHFDDERRREALAMLADLGAHAQIILATHDDTILDSLPAVAVIRLPAHHAAAT